MNRMQVNKGFTLIELLVVVVIVALLATIAMPSYNEHVRRGKRSDGMDAITMILEAQERYYADHLKYTANLADLGASATSPQGHYSLSAASCAGGLSQCVAITATGVGEQAKDGSLMANTQGLRTRTVGGVVNNW